MSGGNEMDPPETEEKPSEDAQQHQQHQQHQQQQTDPRTGGTADGAFGAGDETTRRVVKTDLARDLRAQAARNEMTERRRITQKLRQALAEDGFVLHYQPKLHLKSGTVHGVAAAIRMVHQRRGLLLPAHFMPVAERTDIANDIGAWMLHEACHTARLWPDRFTVSVNTSARLLRGGRLMKHVIEALSRSGLDAKRLELEFSETLLVDDNDDVAFVLKAARAMGVGVALSDFGAGYASLGVFRRLPITSLKIDRSVISELQTGAHDMAILGAAIEAAHAMGITVVADGVETEAQCRLLDQMGCDEALGSYFSHAMPAAELAALITG